MIRVEWTITQAEKLNLFNIDAEDIIKNSSYKKQLKDIKDPIFTKERFFVVRGEVGGDPECCSELMDLDWNFCPYCGDSVEDSEKINEVYRSIKKARESEHAIDLGITDIYVIIVESKEKICTQNKT